MKKLILIWTQWRSTKTQMKPFCHCGGFSFTPVSSFVRLPSFNPKNLMEICLHAAKSGDVVLCQQSIICFLCLRPRSEVFYSSGVAFSSDSMFCVNEASNSPGRTKSHTEKKKKKMVMMMMMTVVIIVMMTIRVIIVITVLIVSNLLSDYCYFIFPRSKTKHLDLFHSLLLHHKYLYA